MIDFSNSLEGLLMRNALYHYQGKLVRVIDGDTFEIEIDLGFRASQIHCVRLLGINCPELHGEEKMEGFLAKGYAMSWFEKHPEFLIRTVLEKGSDKSDSFGRVLGEITTAGGDNLAVDLIREGHGVPRP